MSERSKSPLVLLIDSDVSHRSRLTGLLREAGYDVHATSHESVLQLPQADGAFDGVILCATPEPSTLSPQDHLGEFVLRYMTHVLPALLVRTILLTTLPPEGRRFPDECIAVTEPYAKDELLRLLAERVRRERSEPEAGTAGSA